jgi:hypothetical protein
VFGDALREDARPARASLEEINAAEGSSAGREGTRSRRRATHFATEDPAACVD